MKQTVIVFSMLLMLLLCATCCATKPKQVEADIPAENCADETAVDEKVVTENIVAENIFVANVATDFHLEGPFDPGEFVLNLTGMQVVDVFSDQDIKNWIMLLGKTHAGRQYFDYKSPLYPRPISSADEMMGMFNHQVMIAHKINPSYTLDLDVNIRNAESAQLELKKTLTLKIQPGTTIRDYRRERVIKYTVRGVDGKLRYGEYAIISAVVTQNETEAQAYSALQEWLEQANETDIADLFVKLFAKKMADKSKGVDRE